MHHHRARRRAGMRDLQRINFLLQILFARPFGTLQIVIDFATRNRSGRSVV